MSAHTKHLLLPPSSSFLSAVQCELVQQIVNPLKDQVAQALNEDLPSHQGFACGAWFSQLVAAIGALTKSYKSMPNEVVNVRTLICSYRVTYV